MYTASAAGLSQRDPRERLQTVAVGRISGVGAAAGEPAAAHPLAPPHS